MDHTLMKTKPILPLLAAMALPAVISMIVNSLYNIIDSFFVAMISEDALTAVSLVFPIQNAVNAVSIGFGVGPGRNGWLIRRLRTAWYYRYCTACF